MRKQIKPGIGIGGEGGGEVYDLDGVIREGLSVEVMLKQRLCEALE